MTRKPLKTYLRTYRKRAGLSQEQLAALGGNPHGSSVSRHERGNRLPGLEQVLIYEIILGAPVRKLYAGLVARARAEIKRRAKAMLEEAGRSGPGCLRPVSVEHLKRLADVEEFNQRKHEQQ